MSFVIKIVESKKTYVYLENKHGKDVPHPRHWIFLEYSLYIVVSSFSVTLMLKVLAPLPTLQSPKLDFFQTFMQFLIHLTNGF